jgi:lipopolysaccharide export system protein LptA
MNLNAEFSTDKLTINSSTIKIIKDQNEILFDGNVFIKSRDFVINADKATLQ